MLNRSFVINYLIKQNNFKSYLEIGLRNPSENFDKIKCEHKESVDPFINMDGSLREVPENVKSKLTYHMTSDEMFLVIDKDKKYDIIFIDGLHYDKQVAKDIYNSMQHLSDNGIIIMHDCLPTKEEYQVWPWQGNDTWNGNTWKTLPTIATMCNIEYEVINTDWGLGILHKQQLNFDPKKYNSVLEWKDYAANVFKLMHVISLEDFLLKY